ncbi:MAG: M56 family metallopeptidase, partial [Catenulispora sp.]|nr:M56 family metallopeptidase [Catenulispora sp.]
MRLIVYLPLLIPLLAALGARPVAVRLHPRDAVWLLTGTAVVLAGATAVALGLLAATAVIRIPLVASLGHWSQGVLGRDDPAGTATAVAAGLVLGVLTLLAGRFAAGRGRALVDAFRHARSLPGTGDVVVSGDDGADAYALPGRPGRIVVTAGMLDALDADGRAALLAHERAHLDGRHYVFTSASRLAAAANPLLRPLAVQVEFAVERWADEQAAAALGDRTLVARTIATAAVTAKRHRAHRRIAAALGIGGSRANLRAMAGAGPDRKSD